MHRQTTFPSTEKKAAEYLPSCTCAGFEWYKLAKKSYELLQKLDVQIENQPVWLYRKRYSDMTVYFAVPDVAPHYGTSINGLDAKNPLDATQFKYENGCAIMSADLKKELIDDLNFRVQGGMEDLVEMYDEINFKQYGFHMRAPTIPSYGIKDCANVHAANKAAYLEMSVALHEIAIDVAAQKTEIADQHYEIPRLR